MAYAASGEKVWFDRYGSGIESEVEKMCEPIIGFEVGSRLAEAGLVPKSIKRIVIDIPLDGIVTIYYECVADKNTVEVAIEEFIKNKKRLKVVPVAKAESETE